MSTDECKDRWDGNIKPYESRHGDASERKKCSAKKNLRSKTKISLRKNNGPQHFKMLMVFYRIY